MIFSFRAPYRQSWARFFSILFFFVAHLSLYFYERASVLDPSYGRIKVTLIFGLLLFIPPLWKNPFSARANFGLAFLLLGIMAFGFFYRPVYSIGYFQTIVAIAFLVPLSRFAFRLLVFGFGGAMLVAFGWFWERLPDSRVLLERTDQYAILLQFVILLFVIQYFFVETRMKEERKNKKFALIGRQVSMTLHDLKGMLAASEAYLPRLGAAGKGSPIFREALGGIATDLEGIRSALAALNRLVSPSLAGDERTMLSEAFEEVRTLLKGKLRSVSFELDGDLEVPMGKGDLSSILLNVVLNSLEASDSRQVEGERRRIRILAKDVRGGILIEVVDWAGGFDSVVLDKLSVGKVVSERQSGSGLGIYLIRDVMERYRGRVEFVNRDGGAVVRLTFMKRAKKV